MNKQITAKKQKFNDKTKVSAKNSGPVNRFDVLDSDSDNESVDNNDNVIVQKQNTKLSSPVNVKTKEIGQEHEKKPQTNFLTKEKRAEPDISNENNTVKKETTEPGLPTVSSFSKFENVSGWQSAPAKRKNVRVDKHRQETGRSYSRDDTNSQERESDDKQLYVEDTEIDYGNKLYLNSKWTVWVHKSECKTWKESDYTLAYEIDSVGTQLRFLNNFHLYDKQNFQFFIMRNKIKPIWEDNENRKGFICSFKFDCLYKPGRIDIGTEAMFIICLLVMNETFTTNNKDINGISYSIKNKSVLIKIWNRNGSIDLKTYEDKMRQSLLKLKLESLVRNSYKGYSKNPDDLVSIQCRLIEPEYEA